MRQRCIPYGYRMEKGNILENSEESEIVRSCFQMYLEGCSFQKIAEHLTGNRIEYLKGKFDWNKNRVKRMIQDERYIGKKEGYAVILDFSIFKQAQALIENRTTYSPSWDEDIGIIRKKAYCGCGHPIRRRTTKTKDRCIWSCSKCGYKTILSDSELVDACTQILQRIIKDNSLIYNHPAEMKDISELEHKRELNIVKALIQEKADVDAIIQEIFQGAAQKYEKIQYPCFVDEELRVEFAKAKPLSVFNKELFSSTVSEVVIGAQICLRLKNNVLIKKDESEIYDKTGN